MGSAFDAVGDVLGDVVEFAVDDILEPVFDFVGGIVEGMGDDPFGTLLTIASFIPGAGQYIWIARAALTAAQGGSLTDIAISAASSYVGSQVGGWAKGVTATAVGASVNAATGEVIGTVTEKLIVSAAEGAARGIVGASLSALGSGEFDVETIARAGFTGALTATGSAAFSEFTSTGVVDGAAYDAEFADYTATLDAVDSGVADLAAGFRDLPKIAQEVIKNTAAASVTAAISDGDVDLVDVLGPAVAKAATSVYLTEDVIKNLYSKDTPEVTQSVGYLINAVNRSIDAAFVGTGIVEAFNSSVAQDQFKNVDLSKIVDYLTSDKVLNLFSKEREASDALEDKYREAAIIADQEDDLETELEGVNRERDKVNAAEAALAPYQAQRAVIEAKIKQRDELIAARNIPATTEMLPDEGDDETPPEEGLFYESVVPARIDTSNDTQIRQLSEEIKEFVPVYNELVGAKDSAIKDFNYVNNNYAVSVANYNTSVENLTAEINTLKNTLDTTVGNTSKIIDPFLTKFTAEAVGGVVTKIAEQTEYERLENARIEAEAAEKARIAAEARDDQIAAEAAEKARIAAEAEFERVKAKQAEDKRIEDKRIADLKIKNDNAKAEIAEKYPDFNANEYAELYGVPSSAIGDDPDEEGTTWGDGSDNSSAEVHYLNNKEGGGTNVVNQEKYDAKLDQQIMSDVLGLVFDDQSSLTGKLTPENLEAFYDAVKSGVGYDLEADSESVVAAAKKHLSGLESRGTIASVSIDKGSVTDADIASGRAVAIANRLGDKLGISFVTAQVGDKIFDNKLNRHVIPVFDMVSNTVMYIDPDTEEPLKGFVGGEIQEDGSVKWNNNTISIVPLPPESFTVKDVFDFNPSVAIDIALSLGEDSENLEGLDPLTSALLRTANKIRGLTEASDSQLDIAEGLGVDLYAIKLAAGTALSAGGGLADSFNKVLTFFRDERNKPIDARNTNLGKVSAAILDIAIATNPEEYNAAIKKFDTDIGAATGYADTANAIWEGFKEAPQEVLVEVVGQEILQEIPLIVASAGTGLAVKGVALASKLAVALTEKLGRGVAWGTNAALQVLETAGSVAGETYAELYDEAIKMGVAPDKAAELAQKGGIANGTTAAIIEGTIGRLFDVGDIVSKKIAGSNDVLFESALKNIAARGLGVAGEAFSEGIEGAASTGFKIKLLEGINPAVTKKGGKYADWAGDVTIDAILGAFAGFGTSASIVTGEVMLDTFRGGTFTGADGVTPDSYNPPPTDSGNSTANALITFNPVINQAVKDAGSDDTYVSEAAKDTLTGLLNYDALSDTDTYENDFVYNTATEVLNTAFPDEYNTSEEVGGYFSDISADLGVVYDPSDSEILQLTGPTSPDTALDTTEAITGIISDNALTIPEIQQVGADMGYTFSDGMDYGEIPGIGVGTPEEQAAAIAYLQNEYVPSRQFTEGNLEAALGSPLFSTLTLEQKEKLIGQGDEGYNLAQIEVAKDYRNKREVTSEEATAAIEAEGYTKPSDPEGAAAFDAEVAKYVGVSNDPTHQETTSSNIISDIGPRYIQESEARQAYLDLGVTNPTEADINRFIGLGSEDELSTNITSYLPVATYNSVQEQAAQQAAAQEAAQQAAQEAALAQQTQIATAIATQQAADEKRRQEAQQQQLFAQLSQRAQTTVDTPDVAKIGTPYDPFGDSIFANENSFDTLFDPKGAEPMPLAAAKGGLIMDPTDEILRILGGR